MTLQFKRSFLKHTRKELNTEGELSINSYQLFGPRMAESSYSRRVLETVDGPLSDISMVVLVESPYEQMRQSLIFYLFILNERNYGVLTVYTLYKQLQQ